MGFIIVNMKKVNGELVPDKYFIRDTGDDFCGTIVISKSKNSAKFYDTFDAMKIDLDKINKSKIWNFQPLEISREDYMKLLEIRDFVSLSETFYKKTLSEKEKEVIFNLGHSVYTPDFVEHWINRNDIVDINAPAALQAVAAKAYYQAVVRMIKSNLI